MADQTPAKDQGLSVILVGDRIVISIGISALATATNGHFELAGYRVTDEAQWAKSIVDKLNEEDEEGSMPVHLMFDQAFDDALNDGDEGVERFLTSEEEDVLREYADMAGEGWKQRLKDEWPDREYPGFDGDHGRLTRIYGDFGPRWLDTFTFSPERPALPL